MTVTVQSPGWGLSPKAVAMRVALWVLDRYQIRYITIYVDRRDKPAWTAQIGWL